MLLFNRLPFRCRACSRRFYVWEPPTARVEETTEETVDQVG
jgi:hypothetical protein